jgi:hypothetical protein
MRNATTSALSGAPAPPVFAVMHREVRARLSELTDEVIVELQRAIPAYRDVPAAELVEGVAGDMERAIDAVAGARAATAEELEACEAVGEARAHQGVPVEALIQAFQVAAERTLAMALAEGERAGASANDLLTFSRIAWSWANEAMTRAARAHRRTELDLVRRDVHQRDELLRSLVFGTASPSLARMRMPVYGMNPSAPQLVVRARPLTDAGHPADATAEAIRRARPKGLLVGMVDGDVVIVSAEPFALPAEVCAGRSGPAPVGELPSRFADASRALDAAWSYGLPGIHELQDVALLASVVLDRRVGELLAARLVEPLGNVEEQERICATLEALFAHDLKVLDAAAALHVHENTVRKRLRLLEERTGANLKRVEDLVALWWVLRHRELRAAV